MERKGHKPGRLLVRLSSTSLLIGWLALSCSASHAHHGFAAIYDVSDQVRIEGTIHRVRYRNPHSEISVRVPDSSGGSTIWSCETQASSILNRKGITEDRFPVGESIVITGARARRHKNRCEIGTAYLPDGSSVTMRSADGRANISVNPVSAGSTEMRDSIFGNWVRDSFTGAPVRPGFLDMITEAGREANSRYVSSRDDPTRACRPVNPVRAMIAPGTPSAIRREGGQVLIQHEFMDTTRVIYLNNQAPEGARGDMGWSNGRFEDDTLVIETRHFAPGVLLTQVGDSGVLHSDQLVLVESFGVDSDTGQLVYRWDATDPEFFTGTIGGQLALSPTSLAIGEFDCQPFPPE